MILRMTMAMLAMMLMMRMWQNLPQSPRGSTGGMRDWRNESQKVTFEKIVNNQQTTNKKLQQPNKGEPESYFWRDYYLTAAEHC